MMMEYLKKFNEDILVGVGGKTIRAKKTALKCFTISNEDLEDFCLMLTDIGFSINIYKYFESGLTDGHYHPVYNINLDRSDVDEEDDYMEENINILSEFKSSLHKIKLHPDIYKVLFYINGPRYKIKIMLDEVKNYWK